MPICTCFSFTFGHENTLRPQRALSPQLFPHHLTKQTEKLISDDHSVRDQFLKRNRRSTHIPPEWKNSNFACPHMLEPSIFEGGNILAPTEDFAVIAANSWQIVDFQADSRLSRWRIWAIEPGRSPTKRNSSLRGGTIDCSLAAREQSRDRPRTMNSDSYKSVVRRRHRVLAYQRIYQPVKLLIDSLFSRFVVKVEAAVCTRPFFFFRIFFHRYTRNIGKYQPANAD